MNKIQIENKVGISVDSNPTDVVDVLTNASYFERAAMIEEEEKDNLCDDSGGHSTIDSYDCLSSKIAPSHLHSNHIESEQANFNKTEDQANIESVYVTPIEYVDDWRSLDDLSSRCRLMEEISRQILSKRINREPLKHLPKMVQQLEIVLYRCAPSIHFYKNEVSLEQRLDSMAAVFKRKIRKTHTNERFKSKINIAMGTLAICDMKNKLQMSKMHTRPESTNFRSTFKFQVRHNQGHSYAA
mmetsp:Transcript_36633/g.44233  ORF Transcript_36633/g.44233 Transcript_36633/m.44233 type:complete len:242 (+) Transcript_36633:44-769(+)